MLYSIDVKKALLFLIFLLVLAPSAFAEFISGEVIVKFKSAAALNEVKVSSPSISILNNKYKIKTVKRLFEKQKTQAINANFPGFDFSREFILSFDEKEDLNKIIEEYKKDPSVEYAQPNYIYHAHRIPSDSLYSGQWGLQKIKAPAAWDISTGESSSAIAAVLDTGADFSHEDLAAKLVAGYDYVNGDNNPTDDNGHGTHVAGIIGAITNNSIGVAGMDWTGKILVIKVLDYNGDGSTASVKQGLIYAADAGAKAINMSLGQYFDDTSLREGADYATAKGCLMIASSGNDGVSTPCYPAYYSQIIAVGATDTDDKRSIWGTQSSNYGSWVDVSAPGTLISSTWKGSAYAFDSGTSMAAPFVTGLGSLLFSINPTLTPAQVKQVIEDTSDSINSINPGYENLLGKGRINAEAALMANVSANITSPANNQYVAGSLPIIGTASGYSFNSYKLYLISAATTEVLTNSTTKIENGTLYTLDSTILADGQYTLRLVCYGFMSSVTTEKSILINVDNTYPLADITAPTNGASVEGTVSIMGTASDANLDYYVLEYAKAGENYITLLSSSASQPLGLIGTWNASNLSGYYNLKLTSLDKAGLQKSSIVQVLVVNRVNPVSLASPTRMTPNPFNPTAQPYTYINYSLTQNAETSIIIFDMNGNVIFQNSFIAGEMGGKAGENLVPWNGRTLFGEGVSNGIYIYKIISQNKVIGSGRLIVLRS